MGWWPAALPFTAAFQTLRLGLHVPPRELAREERQKRRQWAFLAKAELHGDASINARNESVRTNAGDANVLGPP